jgi:uncharacterized protein
MNENFRAGLALSAALVLSAAVCSWSFLHSKKLNQTIQVTGSAKKRIKSDRIVWRTSVSAEASGLAESYAKVSRDVEKVKSFLVAHGVPQDQIVVSAIATTPIRPTPPQADRNLASQSDSISGRISAYRLKQSLEIRSGDIDKISAVSRQVTELITQGIFLESEEPEYLYTHLAEAKVEILAAAARDARERAKQIAESGGSGVGVMRSADMGVLQITPADSYNISDYGENDTKSLEKDINAVVHMSFALE